MDSGYTCVLQRAFSHRLFLADGPVSVTHLKNSLVYGNCCFGPQIFKGAMAQQLTLHFASINVSDLISVAQP